MSKIKITSPNDGVLQLNIHRPDKKNALDKGMYKALAEAIREADTDKSIRCVILTGSEGVFTSGNDLSDFLNVSFESAEQNPVLEFMTALRDLSKPIIAAVEGPAVGIGTTLLLHCDFVYAGPGAMFSLPFAKLGLCPEFASSLLLPRLAGMLRATEWLLLAEPFDVNEAYAGGLVTSIVDHPLEKALLIANVLVKRAPEALRSSKRLLRESQNLSVDDVMQRELSCFSKALSGPEFAEAGQAFFEKRAPNLGLK